MSQVKHARSAALAVVVGLSLIGVPATALAESATSTEAIHAVEVAAAAQATNADESNSAAVADASGPIAATASSGATDSSDKAANRPASSEVREDSAAKGSEDAADALPDSRTTADGASASSQASDAKATESGSATSDSGEKAGSSAASQVTSDSADHSASAGDATVASEGSGGTSSTADSSSDASKEVPAADLTVDAHVGDKGWLAPVSGGGVAGTTGESRRMEAVTISVVAPDGSTYSNDDITYRAHVEGYGWQGWVTGGQVAGTTGESRHMEALQVALREGSDLAAAYEVWYRAHVEGLGWLAWTSAGPVGSTGHGLRLEAIEVELLRRGSAAPGGTSGTAFLDGTCVELQAHVQNVGWQPWTSGSGQAAGTTGEGLRLEALRARVGNAYVDGSVELQAHVQNVGWQGWAGAGQVAGTTGEGLRVEAVRMRLTGGLAELYDVWYRAHVQQFGWMAWTKDGDAAGTTGAAGRMEAVQAVLVAKGSAAPSAGDQGTTLSFVELEPVVYEAHASGLGWMGEVSDGALAGTTGQSRQIEALRVRLGSGADAMPGGVEYRAHVADDGWLGWVSDGAVAGTTGQSRRLEAFQVRLTGEVAKFFDVWYQAHVAGLGWLGWARDGQAAGSTGVSRAVEAVRVKLVLKGNDTPGSTSKPCVTKDDFMDDMTRRAQGYSSSTGYLLMVDCSANKVGIYTGSRGSWSRPYLWTAGTGKASTPTVRGTFTIGSRGYSFSGGNHTCYYWTQFCGDYLFHSILYVRGTFNVLDGTLGQNVSHGCVRLRLDHAKWIYDNVPTGTTVVVYS